MTKKTKSDKKFTIDDLRFIEAPKDWHTKTKPKPKPKRQQNPPVSQCTPQPRFDWEKMRDDLLRTAEGRHTLSLMEHYHDTKDWPED